MKRAHLTPVYIVGRYCLSLVVESLEASVEKWKDYFTIPWNLYSFLWELEGVILGVWEEKEVNHR